MNLAAQLAFIEYAHNRRMGFYPSQAARDMGVDKRTVIRWIHACECYGWGLRFDEGPDEHDKRRIIYRLRGSPLFMRQNEIKKYRALIDQQQREITHLKRRLGDDQ